MRSLFGCEKFSAREGFPQLAHLIRTRFLADPPWACLPRPTLQWHNEAECFRV